MLNDRLAAERNIWLATTRPDGRPQLTPVWFVYADERFWVGTGLQSVKTRNVLANPAVSVALEDGNQPVVAEGRAVVHEDLRPPAIVDAFAAKYGWDITIPEDEDVGTVVLLEIEIVKWLFASPESSGV